MPVNVIVSLFGSAMATLLSKLLYQKEVVALPGCSPSFSKPFFLTTLMFAGESLSLLYVAGIWLYRRWSGDGYSLRSRTWPEQIKMVLELLALAVMDSCRSVGYFSE